LAANFIDDGKSLWLLDWDYAGNNIGSFVILGDNFMRLTTQIGSKYAILITLIFKHYTLNRLP